jgi:YHS domain-containing protein
MAKDSVCNVMVDEKKAQHISEVNGQKVYLCSAHCKSQFDQNPSKYGYQSSFSKGYHTFLKMK